MPQLKFELNLYIECFQRAYHSKASQLILIFNYNKSIQTYLMIDTKQLLSISLLVGSVGSLVYYYKCYKQNHRKKLALQKLQVKRYSQLELQKSTNWVLIKQQCKQITPYKIDYKLGSNHCWFNLVSLQRYRNQIYSEYYCEQDPFKFRSLVHFTSAKKNKKIKMPILTNPDLINIKTQFISVFEGNNKPGFFGEIFKYTAATLVILPQLFLQAIVGALRQSQRLSNSPFINGPQWGTFSITSSLVQSPVVICCKVQNMALIPQIIGINKYDILRYIEDQETKYLLAACAVVSIMVTANWKFIKNAYKNCKELFSQIWTNFMGRKIDKQYQSRALDDQACIVCYARCRNVILKKCMHLILCNRCLSDRENPIQFCPMCRVQVDGENVKLLAYQ